MSVAYNDIGRADIPHATMNTRIAQQVGASFGIAIVAIAAALALPAARSAEPLPAARAAETERRRGASLEDAILDAAWEQLTAEGYGHFTIDTVAARARTSKPCCTDAGRPVTSSCTPPSATAAPSPGRDRPGPPHPRIASLPFDLWRHEVMMTLKPVPDHVLRQIVDDIFIPLVARRDEQDDR
jgi:hypothetical protein